MAVATQDSVNHSFVRRAPVDALPAPGATTGAIGWMRANLFSSATNIALTLFSALLIFWLIPPIIDFIFVHAVWSGTDREACVPMAERPEVGACWAFVRDRFSYFIYGSYPISGRRRGGYFFFVVGAGVV